MCGPCDPTGPFPGYVARCGDRAAGRSMPSVRSRLGRVEDSSQPAKRLGLLAACLLVGAVALVALAAASLVRGSCLHAPPPVLVPVPGTPRAGYCAAVNGGAPWLLLVGAPAMAQALMTVALRRWPRWCGVAAMVLVVGTLVNAGVAGSLESSVTI